MSATSSDPAQVAVATELASQTALLHALLAEDRGELLQVAVGDVLYREMVLEHLPVPGVKRAIAYRTGFGFDALPVPLAGVSVLLPNEAAIGRQLVNSGANPIVLYLSDAKRGGIPTIWLAANGGSWDGRFSNALWIGNVFAVAQTAPSTLAGGEF